MHDTLVLDDHVGLYKVSGMSYVALVVVDMLMLLGMFTLGHYYHFAYTSCSSGDFWGCRSDPHPVLGIFILVAKYLHTVQEVVNMFSFNTILAITPSLVSRLCPQKLGGERAC